MTDLYEPTACSLHDEYEIAIMQKRPLSIKWTDETGEQHSEIIMPKDILVKNKEEFLIADTHDNKELCIRLDKVLLLS